MGRAVSRQCGGGGDGGCKGDGTVGPLSVGRFDRRFDDRPPSVGWIFLRGQEFIRHSGEIDLVEARGGAKSRPAGPQR